MLKTDMIKAKIIPPELCQRVQVPWDWNEIKIQPNSQCMDCMYHDLMYCISKEFNLKTLYPGSVQNYMAVFFGTFKSIFGVYPRREKFFSSIYHNAVINEILNKNNIPVKIKRLSTNNLDFAIQKLLETKRVVGVSMNSAVGRHMILILSISSDNLFCSDYFGKNPYNLIKKGGHYHYNKKELSINSVIWIEDENFKGDSKK